jgi:signal transduction histidine kinase
VRDERIGRLLDAVLAVTSDHELETVLRRVVEAARSLVGARYAALGVLADDGVGLSAFVHTGLDDATVARIGRLPEGRGILGVLIAHPEPLRLDDLKDHPASFGFPPNHPPMHAFLGTPILVRDEVFGNLYLTEKEGGGSFTEEDEELVGGLAAVAGAAIADARLITDLQRRERWRDAVLEVATTLLGHGGAARARDQVAEVACRLLAGDGAAVVVADVDGRRVVTSVGAAPPVGPVTVESPVDAVLRHGTPVRTDRSVLFDGAAVWTALSDGDRVVAALGVGRADPWLVADADQLELFAAQASLALAHERATEDLRRLELIEDRERIGRDLHDTVIQRLFATGLGLQALARRVDDRPEVASRLAQAVDDVDATVKEIRSTIFALQAPPEVQSVRSDVLQVCDEIASLLSRPPRVRFHGPVDTAVGASLAEHLVPVVREALTNVAKHAQADDVEVDLLVEGAFLQLIVRDDGVGGVADRPGGFGLGNLHDRASACGGHVEIITPATGQGTEVRWRVPVR